MNSRNATVEFPNAPLKVFPNPKAGMNPSASSVIILGQSIETVIHMSSEPKNTPKTLHASVLSPPDEGMNRDPMIRASDSTRKIISFVFFCFIQVLLV